MPPGLRQGLGPGLLACAALVQAGMSTAGAAGGGSFTWAGSRRTAGIRDPAGSHHPCTIPRIPAAEFTRERYTREFEGKSPFILTGATDGWSAAGWDMQGFRSDPVLKAVRVQAEQYGLQNKDGSWRSGTAPLEDVMEYVFDPKMAAWQRSSRMRVDGKAFLDPTLEAGFTAPAWAGHQAEAAMPDTQAPNFVHLWRRAQTEWIRNLSTVMMQGQSQARRMLAAHAPSEDRFLIFGPSASGDKPHYDGENVSFWNAMLHGRKRWLFFKPAQVATMEQNSPGVVLGWGATHPQTQTAFAWYADWYATVRAGWTGASWWQGSSDATLRPLECIQLPGDMVYGPGGMLHVVLSIEDGLAITEQIMDESNFRGSMAFGAAAQQGLLELGLCNANVERLTLQTVEQLSVVMGKPLGNRLHVDEISNPQMRVLSKYERAMLVSTWLATCAAMHRVRPDLWETWTECAELYKHCGSFLATQLGFRTDYDFYPEFKPKAVKQNKHKSRKRRAVKKSKLDL